MKYYKINWYDSKELVNSGCKAEIKWDGRPFLLPEEYCQEDPVLAEYIMGLAPFDLVDLWPNGSHNNKQPRWVDNIGLEYYCSDTSDLDGEVCLLLIWDERGYGGWGEVICC